MYKRLDEMCIINMGQSPRSESYNDQSIGLPFFQGNADFGEIYPNIRIWTNTPTKIVDKGCLLISVRAPIGALNFSTEKCCIGRGLAGITAKENVCLKYIYYCLKYNNKDLNSRGTGSTFKAISKNSLAETKIKYVVYEKQINCANNLDKLYLIIRNREKQLKLLDNLIKSRFVEMFGNLNSSDFSVVKWEDVFSTTTGKLDSNASEEKGKYPFFTCSKETLFINDYAFDQEALLLAGNNAAGKYDVKYYKGKFNAYQRTYVLTLKDRWSYTLFKYQLEDKLLLLQQQSLGGLTKYLTMKILNELEFILPPIELQNEFADFVRQVDKSKFVIELMLKLTCVLYKKYMSMNIMILLYSFMLKFGRINIEGLVIC
ncbi:MAG: restriction endonuclease subunit S [Longibaculum sp.]